MSKTPRRKTAGKKKRPAPEKTAGIPIGDDMKRRLFVALAVVILAGIPFALGKYFEFNSPSAFDSGAYVYSAAHVLAGAEIGVEEKPSARLGTLLVNLLGVRLWGYSDIGPKVVQMILQAAALAFLFVTIRRLYGTLAAVVSVAIASIYLSAPLLAKFGNVKEQYMVAFMVMGISCFVFYELKQRWWWAVLAGGLLSWAPLFKQTGLSAVGALGLYLLCECLFKRKTWKQMGLDIALLGAGVVLAIGPAYVWILGFDVQMSLPYAFAWRILGKLLPGGGAGGGAGSGAAAGAYISESRKLVPFSRQWPIVLRYYAALVLPISLAVAAIGIRVAARLRRTGGAAKQASGSNGRFVVLFAVWWLLDMAFIWISPRSYEQYYLPLNASAAMLGGYLVGAYTQRLQSDRDKTRWIVLGLLGILLMMAMSWHIFFGIAKSPHSGAVYRDYSTREPARRNGYLQKWRQVSKHPVYPWQRVGRYIREHSDPDDKMYVWGWFPGIYVEARRFSSASLAFTMPRKPPAVLERSVAELLAEFEADMPRFIVDSRKRHIPTERPPYELWPIAPKGFMGLEKAQFLPANNAGVIKAYDQAWSKMLREQFDEDEALRYDALEPFRRFVRENYRIVQMFGDRVLFERKGAEAENGSQ